MIKSDPELLLMLRELFEKSREQKLLEEINSVSEMTKVEHEAIPRHAGEIGVLLNRRRAIKDLFQEF